MAKVTNQDIFTASRKTLAAKGYEKARLADVARELNITSAALYKHFENKEALFEETLMDWLEEVDAPMFEANVRAPEGEREAALHDWLWLLASRRRDAFLAEPAMRAFYSEKLSHDDHLVGKQVDAFAEIVENIMAWDTFRHQRGLMLMQAFNYFYYPYFATRWEDQLYKPLFESNWIELLPVVQNDGELN